MTGSPFCILKVILSADIIPREKVKFNWFLGFSESNVALLLWGIPKVGALRGGSGALPRRLRPSPHLQPWLTKKELHAAALIVIHCSRTSLGLSNIVAFFRIF